MGVDMEMALLDQWSVWCSLRTEQPCHDTCLIYRIVDLFVLYLTWQIQSMTDSQQCRNIFVVHAVHSPCIPWVDKPCRNRHAEHDCRWQTIQNGHAHSSKTCFYKKQVPFVLCHVQGEIIFLMAETDRLVVIINYSGHQRTHKPLLSSFIFYFHTSGKTLKSLTTHVKDAGPKVILV